MITEPMTSEVAVDMLKQVANAVIKNVDVLTDADLAIGDGDHGIGMRRGFEAVLEAFEVKSADTVAGAFSLVGTAIMSKTGGAAGAVFGTLFRSGAKAYTDAKVMDARNFSEFLQLAQIAVAKRGGVEEGQKTMLDALAPASRAALEAAQTGTLKETLAAASQAALAGVEASKDMIATTGKARSLGERSLGHPDPGAITVSIILGAMHEAL